MRRVLLFGSFLALLLALGVLWAYRFERSPGMPVWRLADLRAGAPPMPGVVWSGTPEQPVLRIRVDAENPQVAARFALPGMPPVAMLHLRFRMSSRALIPGREKWQDGRLLVEWHPPDGGAAAEQDPCRSIRYDHAGEWEAFVLHPRRAPAVPALRLEHLGCSGEFDLSDLEITVVNERALWRIGRGFLVFGWLAWCVACIRSWPGVRRWRAVSAAAVWLLMGMYCAIPGPWKIQRAMVPAFQIGEERVASTLPDPVPLATPSGKPPLPITSAAVPTLAELPDQGDWILRVRHHLSHARPLLHVLLLLGPTLAMALLAGRKPALALAVLFAMATELAQIAFGYGFNWLDVGDLACDATGIALAIWIYQKISAKSDWC